MAKSDRGFASMDSSKQKNIASKGGKASGTNRSAAATSNKRGAAGDTPAAKRGGQNSHHSN